MSGPFRLFPSSFDPEDPSMHGVPVPLEWRWSSVEEKLKSWGSKGVMMRLPLFWQLEVPIFHACRAAGAFLFTNDIGNIPLGVAAVRTVDIDTVITTYRDAITFAEELTDKNAHLPLHWVIIRSSAEAQSPLPNSLKKDGVLLFEEIHLSPGIAVSNV